LQQLQRFIVIDQVTFAQFDAILEQLGFEKTVIPGSHLNYKHPKSGAFLLAQIHKPSDLVPTYVLLGTRGNLEIQGVIAKDEFERMLQAVAA
jgi:predicted RNA binding protein YcfA (HicA-like mRNA interferase family)